MYETGTATDYLDLMEKLNTFLTTNGSAFNLSYSGTGNGTLTGYKGGSASVAETFTITATSSTNFTVTGSVSGSLSAATVGTPYTGTKIQFTINAGGTAFVAGDTWTISTAPKWTLQRANRAKSVIGSFNEKYIAFNYHQTLSGGATSTVSAFPAQLGCQLASAATITGVVIYPDANGGTYSPSAFDLQYSDDGSSWTTLQSWSSLTSGWTAYTGRSFTVTSPVSHAYWRINVTASNGANCNIARLEFRNAGGVVSHWDCIWKAPGNDGARSIYVGVMPFAHVTADYYNWRIGGFTGYTDQQYFANQAGPCTDPVLPLWQNSMTYWFVADGNGVKLIIKVSSSYETACMGLIDPYASPGQFPYPLAIGAPLAHQNAPALNSTSWRWSYAGTEHAAPWRGSGVSLYDTACNLRLRKQDGTWRGFSARSKDESAMIWPNFNVMTDLRPNLDGSLALFPYILNDNGPNCWGEINGVYAVSGYSNGSENTVTIGGVQHLVVQDISRTTTQSYAAVKLN